MVAIRAFPWAYFPSEGPFAYWAFLACPSCWEASFQEASYREAYLPSRGACLGAFLDPFKGASFHPGIAYQEAFVLQEASSWEVYCRGVQVAIFRD